MQALFLCDSLTFFRISFTIFIDEVTISAFAITIIIGDIYVDCR